MAQLIMTQALKQEISTPAISTQVILSLFIGETYVEVGFFDYNYITDAKSKKNKQLSKALFTQLYYLPHQSLKSIFAQVKKIIAEKNFELNETYIVSRYLERLQNFRLGGSVAQLISAGFENSTHFGNSLSLSLANPSLIISKNLGAISDEDLQKDVEHIKKINPDCDKIIIYDFQETNVNEIFAKNGFQIFNCSTSDPSAKVRKTMFNAGVSGTQKEFFSDILELTQNTPTAIWFDGKWNDLIEIQSLPEQLAKCAMPLYMSGVDFLFHLNKSTPDHPKRAQFHIDFDNWEVIKQIKSKSWKSPWGEIQFESEFTKETLSISPRQEILIDETSRLQISKNSISTETGPFIAGRSVKSVVIDLFSDEILNPPGLYKMIGSPDLAALNTKIKSQFKALENGQKSEIQISCKELKNLISDSVQTRISFDGFESVNSSLMSGNLAFLFSSKLNSENNDCYFWSNSIAQQLIHRASL
jgi:hypothetical protein